MLSIDSINKMFRDRSGGKTFIALHDVSLTIERGDFVGIVGPSGCGKTTLLRLIHGLESPTSGRISFDRTDSKGGPRIGFVFQQPALFPWRTVRQNVEFGLRAGVGRSLFSSDKERTRAVNRLLDLTGLYEFDGHYPSEISGGMKQRTNLCRALSIDPQILLMDEPFGALDAITREQLQKDFSDIVAQLGITVVLVTHDIRESVFLAHRVVVMANRPGRIVGELDVGGAVPRDAGFYRSDAMANYERRIFEMLSGDGAARASSL